MPAHGPKIKKNELFNSIKQFFFRKLKYAYLHAHYHFVESQRFVQSTGAPYHTCSVCPGSEKFG